MATIRRSTCLPCVVQIDFFIQRIFPAVSAFGAARREFNAFQRMTPAFESPHFCGWSTCPLALLAGAVHDDSLLTLWTDDNSQRANAICKMRMLEIHTPASYT